MTETSAKFHDAWQSIPPVYLTSRFQRGLHAVHQHAYERAFELAMLGTSAVYAGGAAEGKTRLAVSAFEHMLREAAAWDPATEPEPPEARRLRASLSRYVRAQGVLNAVSFSAIPPLYYEAGILILDDLGLEDSRGVGMLADLLLARADWRRTTLITTPIRHPDLFGRRYGAGVQRRYEACWIDLEAKP